MAVEREKMYLCEVKRRRVKDGGGGFNADVIAAEVCN